jgi:energy-coupling factor transporter ATP-binding protein EcfA2
VASPHFALFEPDERHYYYLPRAVTSTLIRGISTTNRRSELQLRAKVGMVFQKPNPFEIDL